MCIVKKVGFSGFGDGELWTSYLVFGRYWVHINRRHRWPLVSFKSLPF